MTDEQRIVHFGGDVQGVGFRYTACRTALGYEITGYVRNLPDGQVECVVEGACEQIDAFVDELCHRMGRYVRETNQQKAPHSGEFADFSVRY